MTGDLSVLGFWIGLGLFLMGVCIDNGITNLAKAIKPNEEEPVSRTGKEGVFLQPTGSHETDPFVE